MTKEATARIKINRLLEAVGWRFFADGNGAANIRLEPSVTIKSTDLDALGENFEKIESSSTFHRIRKLSVGWMLSPTRPRRESLGATSLSDRNGSLAAADTR